jgi:hypothetical protein
MAITIDYTFNTFLVDAGMLYVGSTPVGWGPTRGGLTFDPGIETRDPEYDGKSTPIDGTLRVTKYNSKISGQILDKSALALGRLLPGYTSDGSTNNVIKPRDARGFIATGDTLSDVLLLFRGSDGAACGAWFKKAMVESWTLSAEDNNEGLFDVSIVALLPTSDTPNDPPFRLISPITTSFAHAGW